ncbi:hypothetical protein [Schumannella sp. 10F1B-5-1]|uniref:hypothetical protein n=1 Tax=Schumannella sp. 10F1B-5-1 TaxID=2590780 RepID=UPI0011309594|nr:hypothetical protein [Schumannella sp. 10F1B-5-1]TPW71699.1 hypothetical protein FJ658_10160 [Schumannella sp. 10F1B-5-1]
MKVRLKFELPCTPDEAWDLVRSPGALTAVSRPWLSFDPVEAASLPDRWDAQAYPVEVHALFGLGRVGEQTIDVSFREAGAARIFTDAGGPTAGALTLVKRWRHQMAVAPGRDGGTLFRDQLSFSAGWATLLVWPALWVFWQWRGRGIRRLAARIVRER